MTLARRGPRKIALRFLPPADPVDLLGCTTDYRWRALASGSPHGLSHDCLVWADLRAVIGALELEPVLAAAAGRMRERDAGVAQLGGLR